MGKQLKIKELNTTNSLTVGEVQSWLNQFPKDSAIVLKCGRNFRLGKLHTVNNMPVLIGRRTSLT